MLQPREAPPPAWPRLRHPEAVIRHVERFPHEINAQDAAGNTVLHYAAEWADADLIGFLLQHGADPRIRNQRGDGPLSWACHLRRATVVGQLVHAELRAEWREWQARLPGFYAALRAVPDCELGLHWAGTSAYIPGLGALLPSDDMRILKRGSCLRLDFTFKGYAGMRLRRGDLSAIFWGDTGKVPGEVWALDHEKRTYEDGLADLKRDPTPEEVQEMAEGVLEASQQRTRVEFSSKDMVFVPKKRWRGGQQAEAVGPWQCSVFEMQNLRLGVGAKGPPVIGEAPPEAGPKGLAKPHALSASLWMTEGFPLTVAQLLPILGALAPVNKRLQKIQQVLECRLPPGFPVKVDVPIKLGVHATAHFTRAVPCSPPQDAFDVPAGYTFRDRASEPTSPQR